MSIATQALPVEPTESETLLGAQESAEPETPAFVVAPMRRVTRTSRRALRAPRVPRATLRALRADIQSAGMTIPYTARLLGIQTPTLESLLSGHQHVSSRLGYHEWPEHVRSLCEQMRAANTILARHLTACAHEITAAGLPLPAIFNPGLASRRGRPAKTGSAGSMVGHASGVGANVTRKRAS